MPYPAANLEILDVEFETRDGSPITQGSNVEVEVDVRNNSNQTSLGIIGVESPSSNNTILQTCVLLSANSTDNIDDSTADGTLDGEFSVLEIPKEVTVTVGGYDEADFVGSCAGMTPSDFETDSKTFMLDSCENVTNEYLDVLQEYDLNDNGSIELNEFQEASRDFVVDGDITETKLEAIQFAFNNNCSFSARSCDKVINNHLDVLQEFDKDFSGSIDIGEEGDAGKAYAKNKITREEANAIEFASKNDCSFPPGSPNLTPSDATIKNVVASGSGTTATMQADVTNNVSFGIDVTVNVTENDNQLAQEVVGVGANSTKTVQFDIDFDVPNNQQVTKTICVEKGNVQVQ